jgi:hypothetical protein
VGRRAGSEALRLARSYYHQRRECHAHAASCPPRYMAGWLSMSRREQQRRE